MKKNSVKKLRKQNQSSVLKEFYFNGPTTRLDVSKVTKLSPATVTNIASDLMDLKVLVEAGAVDSDGGRPSTLLRINPDLGYFIGIELGEEQLRAEIFDVRFNTLEHFQTDLSVDDTSPDQIVSIIVKTLDYVITKSGLDREKIIGIGMGVPGWVNPKLGISIISPNWGWSNVNLGNLIQKVVPIPVHIENGAKAMGIAELLFGHGNDGSDFVSILIGTGVGGAIIYQGDLVRGHGNSAGELGHMSLNPNGPSCRCGSKGCLETYVGAPGIINSYNSLNSGANPLDISATSIEAILDAYTKNEEAAQVTIDQAIQHLGVAIANLINIENPNKVIVGGWVGNLLLKDHLESLRRIVMDYAIEGQFDSKNILISNLSTESVPMGAASLALMDFFNNVEKNIVD